ncbi:MAG: ATP-binding cassette domain-containing protein [Eubacterium sp.]
MEKIIEVKNLFYEYPRSNENESTIALQGVDFSIERGEFVGIIGHNGSGKSTLSKLLNAIIEPTKGDVVVQGMNTKDPEHIWDIRQTAGMVFQNPDNQLVATIVEEDVAFGPENLGIPSEEIRRRVDEALGTVAMEAYRRQKPHQLSGGQKQRIAIARAMANNPSIILADEPTGALDSKTGRMVMDIFHRLHKEQGKTIVLITHNPELAAETERVITLKDGGIVDVKVRKQGLERAYEPA